MRTRGTLQASVPTCDLAKRIPPRFKKYVDASLVSLPTVDLLLFQPGDRYVVSSKDLLQALESRLASEAQLVAVGYDFTDEARSAIAAAGGLAFTEGEYFGWTDEMWQSIHQSRAT